MFAACCVVEVRPQGAGLSDPENLPAIRRGASGSRAGNAVADP
jgi:hypothetical protein